MTETLRELLPKVYPQWQETVHWLVLTHRGKSDLEKSIPRKLRGWTEPGARFVILRDNDGGDCRQRKQRLRELAGSRPADNVLIRIVCQELESWFLGDQAAIKAAFPNSSANPHRSTAKYRNPDRLTNAADELARLTGTKTKVSRAKKIARYLRPESNCSVSFNHFISGLQRLAVSA